MKRFIPVIAVIAAVAAAVVAVARTDPRFDHQQHARLFPLCTSCHEGIETGDQALFYPAARDCAQCHDGKTQKQVDWTKPTRTTSNLRFAHLEHLTEAPDAECESCHDKGQTGKWMNVARAEPDVCMACHAKNQKAAGPLVHLAQTNDCAQCHVPLRNAKLVTAQVAQFPKPPSHETGGFLQEHARTDMKDANNCSVCHTVESCSRCHANAKEVKVITALGSNEVVTSVVAGKKAVYPKPVDHLQASFKERHGPLAEAGIASCSNCHTRDGCQQCHSGRSAADQIAALPLPGGTAVGVNLKAYKRTAHPVGFAEAHGTTAGAAGESCTSCHTQKFCSDCHQGGDSRKFHPANFAVRHAQAVYAGDSECASCHNRESFCQSCHNGLGLNSTGQRSTPFHNGSTIWLLQHGQPARQNLESCTSCHTQSSCARCHSAKGGWGVSPHGSGNRSSKLGDKNRAACLRCHFSGAGIVR